MHCSGVFPELPSPLLRGSLLLGAFLFFFFFACSLLMDLRILSLGLVSGECCRQCAVNQ